MTHCLPVIWRTAITVCTYPTTIRLNHLKLNFCVCQVEEEGQLVLDRNPLEWSVDEVVQFINSTDCASLATIFQEQVHTHTHTLITPPPPLFSIYNTLSQCLCVTAAQSSLQIRQNERFWWDDVKWAWKHANQHDDQNPLSFVIVRVDFIFRFVKKLLIKIAWKPGLKRKSIIQKIRVKKHLFFFVYLFRSKFACFLLCSH